MRFQNKCVIVTGAGRNIGEGVAWRFASEGAKVAVVDIDESRGNAAADRINADHPGSAIVVRCDVSSVADVQRMVNEVAERLGRIDILINNASITDRKTVLELEEDEWDRVIDVALKSVFLCTKYVAKKMVEQGQGGRIINIASTSGHRGRANATAYTAAKGGVLNLTRSLAMQLAPYGILVNSVTPNRVGSPVGEEVVRTTKDVRNLLGRVGEPADIAAACAFLASDDGAFITGIDLLVDGGASAGV